MVSHAQAMVKRFVEKSGGSEDSGSFAQENCSHWSSFGSLGQEAYQLHTCQTLCIKVPSLNILHFRLFYQLQNPVAVPSENDHKPPFDEEIPHYTISNEPVVSLYHLEFCLQC